MNIKVENSPFPDKYYLEIKNFKDITHFLVEKGTFYICFSNIYNLSREIADEEKGVIYCSFLGLFEYEKIVPNENVVMRKDAKLFFENHRIFRRKRINRFLKKYNFSTSEIDSLLREFDLKKNFYVDHIVYISIKTILLIDIMFKNSDLVLFNTEGLRRETAEIVYMRVLKHLKKYPQKTAIIFEHVKGYGKTTFEKISEAYIKKYEAYLEKYESFYDYIKDMQLE